MTVEQVREALKQVKGANVERQGDQLVVQFNSAILFDTNKAKLKPASEKDLAEFAKVLKEYKDTDLIVEGHTDSRGKKARNKKLSLARAKSVIGFLEAQGVTGSRMTPQGYADDRPVASNKSKAGRAQNRRVQIQITANQKLAEQQAAASQQAPAGQPVAAAKK